MGDCSYRMCDNTRLVFSLFFISREEFKINKKNKKYSDVSRGTPFIWLVPGTRAWSPLRHFYPSVELGSKRANQLGLSDSAFSTNWTPTWDQRSSLLSFVLYDLLLVTTGFDKVDAERKNMKHLNNEPLAGIWAFMARWLNVWCCVLYVIAHSVIVCHSYCISLHIHVAYCMYRMIFM